MPPERDGRRLPSDFNSDPIGVAVGLPGPPAGLWALSLLAWATTAAVVGEAVRGWAARAIPLWRADELLERFLLDFYLGGAVLYLLAALEIGAFVPPVVFGLPIVAAGVVVYRVARRRPTDAGRVPGLLAGVNRWTAVAGASALGLFAVELARAVPVPTGNTFDSSLLTTYVAILLQHGSLPLSFQPYASPAILYPQGSSVWFGWAQLVFGLPPARTALLVTPLFLGLAPLGGFVVGRRWLGSSAAGAAFALGMAWLGPATRSLVGGSNDFVLAFPLGLLLTAQAVLWVRRPGPTALEAAGFGLLLGYSAVLNVVVAEWMLPALLLVGVAARPAFVRRTVVGISRWAVAFGATLIAGIPSLYLLLKARTTPSSLAAALTAPASHRVGISFANFIGSLDPFLFGARDIELAPIPLVRLELAVLLVLGAGLLLWIRLERPEAGRWRQFARFAVASAVAEIAWLGALTLAHLSGSPVRFVAFISSSAELSLWLFTLFGLVAVVPLAVALERWPSADEFGPRPGPGRSPPRALWPVAFALVVVVPGLVLTPVALGPVLSSSYADFSEVTPADFQMLAWASAHLAPGERVLVAPGSAAEFLPGYARGIVLLYPMEPGWARINASYSTVVAELTNGTLAPGGLSALAILALGAIVVTGNSTILWPAFWAAPLLAAETNGTPTFPVLFHAGDAWVFDASGCRPGSPACA